MQTERRPFDIDAAVNCVKEYERQEEMLKEMGVRSMRVNCGVRELSVSKEVFIELFAGKQVKLERRDSDVYPYGYSAEYEGVTFDCISREPLHVPRPALVLCKEEPAAEQAVDAVVNFYKHSKERISNDFNKKVGG